MNVKGGGFAHRAFGVNFSFMLFNDVSIFSINETAVLEVVRSNLVSIHWGGTQLNRFIRSVDNYIV